MLRIGAHEARDIDRICEPIITADVLAATAEGHPVDEETEVMSEASTS